MFSAALAKAEKYTYPVVISRRQFDGQVRSGMGTFVVINPNGWIVTCAHIVAVINQRNTDAPHVQEFQRLHQEIEQNGGLTLKQKHKLQGRLSRNPEWITNHAIFWGWPTTKLSNFQVNAMADLAIGQLEGFDPTWVSEYPIFKNPNEPMPPGTSLCRLGFPFHEIKAIFNEGTQRFELAPGSLPAPRFPNDGIHTRVAIKVTPDGSKQAKFIETSTPGLKGQSGGPILDRNGHVWAIQSNTESLPLGFSPKVKDGNREVTEHQFMHVGRGSHVEGLINMLQEFGVAFQLSGHI